MSEAPKIETRPQENLNLLSEIGRLAHGFGVTSHRLEIYLQRVGDALGYTGSFRVTPSSITISISQHGNDEQLVRFMTLPSPGFQLTRLARLSDIMNRFEAGELTIDEALTRIRTLENLSDTYGPIGVGLAYGLCGAGFAVLLSLGWTDVALAFLGSLMVFGLGFLAERLPALALRIEFIAALVLSTVFYLLASFLSGIDPAKITLCGLIVLVPGFGLTVGVAELSAGQITSGLERLILAITTTLKLFFGAVIGWLLVSNFLFLPDPTMPASYDPLLLWAFVVILVVGLAVIFQTDPADMKGVVFAGLVTYAGMTIGRAFGFWQGSFLGAIGLGVIANSYASLRGRPALIIVNPVVMVLVPGAATLLGLQAGALQGSAGGLTAEWQTLVNIMSIVAGLMVANFVMPAKSAL